MGATGQIKAAKLMRAMVRRERVAVRRGQLGRYYPKGARWPPLTGGGAASFTVDKRNTTREGDPCHDVDDRPHSAPLFTG